MTAGAGSLTELLEMAVRAGVARVHTSCPGVIVSYNSGDQTCSVRMIIRQRSKNRDGEVESRGNLTLTSVPVAFPHSGRGGMTFDLAQGDPVTLWFAERSIDEWKATGNDDIEAGDLRRFDISDAVAYPGTRSPASPLGVTSHASGATVVEGADVRLGSSVATQAVALGPLTEAQLTTLFTAISTAPTAPGDGGATFKAAILASLAGWPGNTGAAKVVAE